MPWKPFEISTGFTPISWAFSIRACSAAPSPLPKHASCSSWHIANDATASEIARELRLDFGYLSRLLKRFESTKLLNRVRSPSDARQSSLALTKKGRDTFTELDRSAKKQVIALIQPLTSEQRATLLGAMQTVQGLLKPTCDPPSPFTVRALRTGDIGWIIRRQGMLYAKNMAGIAPTKRSLRKFSPASSKTSIRSTKQLGSPSATRKS